ncbi:large conductance mechanosensitive channel protein MscL [uncultured Serinicoccus sp.]|uniref:large conductance mechanosensitive channel protein MscL n=1 Tax=uncultured Serinicoccus sp. TaxID=735514 RepID=UPI00261041DC|nr:large conductance mechanosensitive channel protein MscL [uncultured Serinicoccus sp.]
MLSGFKDFILRGNVIELAVAVVVGSAFAAVVDTIVSNIITPLLNAAGGAQVEGLKLEIISGRPDTAMDFAAIINAVIVFLITAAVVYFVLVGPMNRITERINRTKAVEEEVISEEVATLREIRDLLAQRRPDATT